MNTWEKLVYHILNEVLNLWKETNCQLKRLADRQDHRS